MARSILAKVFPCVKFLIASCRFHLVALTTHFLPSATNAMVMVVEPSVAVSLRAGKDVLADPDFAGTSHVLEVFVLTDLGASSHSRS